MKKVLFATTALVAMTGAAAAEVTFGGSANAGLRDMGAGANLHYEIDLDIIFSGSTDNGLTFGASMDLDENNSSTDPEIFISGAFGTLTLGELDPMIDNIGIADIGFDGIGVDDDLESLRFVAADTANMTYVYEASGFTFGLSYVLDGLNSNGDNGDYGILLGYEMDGFYGEIAYNKNDSNGASAVGVELGYSTDMYGVTFVYIDNSNGGNGFGLHGSYTIDALTLTAAFADDGGINDYGFGARYDLGGGLALAGGVGQVDDVTVWDLGLTMSF